MYPYPWVLWHGYYRTHRSSGYGYESLTKFQNFRLLLHGRTELPQVPGRYKNAVPVPWVFVAPASRTSRSSGYEYECSTEVTEVLCRVTPRVNTPGMVLCVPNFRVLLHGRTELPQVPGRYKNAVPVPWVFVAPASRTSRSSGYEYECSTEVTEVLCRVTPRVNTPGMVLCVPYRQNENRKLGYKYECRTELTEVPGKGSSREKHPP